MIKRRGFFGAVFAALIALFSKKAEPAGQVLLVKDKSWGYPIQSVVATLNIFHHKSLWPDGWEGYTFKIGGKLTVATIFERRQLEKPFEVWETWIRGLALEGATGGKNYSGYNFATREEAIQHILKELGCDAI